MLLEAERIERERGGALWHWSQFCIAVFLRERGYVQAAQSWLARSGVALRYESAWFALRAGDRFGVASWLRPPIGKDERPFFRALIAATRTARGTRGAYRGATSAAHEFDRSGLQHWVWGATWVAAADTSLTGAQRTRIISALLEQLAARDSIHWGFFDPVAARRLLQSLPSSRAGHSARVQSHLVAWSTPARYDDDALLGSLSLLTVDALSVFQSHGMTPAELRALTLALEIWLESGDVSRTALAERMGRAESSVRSLISDIRGKLGIQGRRGVEPIVSWLAERDLLGPSAAMRAVRRLSGARK